MFPSFVQVSQCLGSQGYGEFGSPDAPSVFPKSDLYFTVVVEGLAIALQTIKFFGRLMDSFTNPKCRFYRLSSSAKPFAY